MARMVSRNAAPDGGASWSATSHRAMRVHAGRRALARRLSANEDESSKQSQSPASRARERATIFGNVQQSSAAGDFCKTKPPARSGAQRQEKIVARNLESNANFAGETTVFRSKSRKCSGLLH